MLHSPFNKRAVSGIAISFIALLAAGCTTTPAKDPLQVSKPSAISFGASVAEMEETLRPLCDTVDTRRFDPPQIPQAEKHDQIDCQGFDYFGGDRLAEFVFKDDALVLTWILVKEPELPALEAAFTAEFGEPTIKTKTITGYTNDFSAVRYDTPEALYYSPEIAPLVEGMIGASGQ